MSKLSKNIVYNLAGQGMLLVLGFISIKYVFRQLGEDALGIIYFTATLNMVLASVLDKSVSATTVREVSTHVHDAPEYLRGFIRTGSLLCWSVYALLALAVYAGAPVLVEKWIHLKTLDPATATRILRILGVASLSAFPRSFYASLLRGLQRMELNNCIDVSVNALQQSGTILILARGGDIFHVVYWFAACYGMSVLAYFLVAGRFFSLRALLPGYSSAAVEKNRRFASSMASVSVLAMVHNQAEKVMVSKWLPLGILGFYSFAYDIVSKAGLITGSIAQAALPSLSALHKAGDRENLLSQYGKLQDLISFMTVPVFAAIHFSALPLFTYLFNAQIAAELFLPVSFLCFGFYLNGTLNIQYQFSLAAGKPEIAVRSNGYALFILPITALLISRFALAGAGLSWVLFNVFVYGYSVPIIYRECIGLPVRTWYAHMLKVLALAGATYGLAWAVLAYLGAYSIMALAVAYTVASLVFCLCAYRMIGAELRRTLADHLLAFRDGLRFKQARSVKG